MLLEGLNNLLTAHGIHVIGMARDGLEAVALARATEPDVILMDIRMPRCDGLEATRRIKAEMPRAVIVIHTTSTEDQDLFEAVKCGAFGYLQKSVEGMEKRRAVLYGRFVILGTLNASLRQYPHLEVVSLSPPFPSTQELSVLEPDVILFDIEAARPEAAFSLLGACPGLLLIGIDPSTNQALLWSGRHLRELSTQDLVQVINRDDPGSAMPRDRNLDGG